MAASRSGPAHSNAAVICSGASMHKFRRVQIACSCTPSSGSLSSERIAGQGRPCTWGQSEQAQLFSNSSSGSLSSEHMAGQGRRCTRGQ
eukprot:1119306-Pelagomonas_calceolata.AAC.1